MIKDLWYKNAIIYSLDLETFMDGNGDGIGDFAGLSGRLEYLHSLGVDTIWLAPFQPTPNKDNGYDISDYYGVDPRHGSSGDFVEFMHHAHKRGIKVIIDLVVNHTSDQHPWFQESRSSKDNPKRDWYHWADKKPENWNEGMVFPGLQDATWTYDKKAGAWYFHRFFKHQPDLNMGNPEVREEVNKIIGYWLELGVAGFRLDAVPFILEATEPGKHRPEMKFEYLEEMRNFLQWRKGNAVFLGEANVLPKENKKYFGEDGSGIHLMFNFYVNQHLFYALASADIEPLKEAIIATKNIPENAQWGQFLRNHDELDLGRLTEEQREKVFARFGPEEHMQLFHRGIRRRLAPMLGNQEIERLAYSLMFSLPGTPVIRYGDEIGMGENLELPGRTAVRTPMQWSAEKQAGFSSAEKLVHPVINKGPYAYRHVNAETQRREPDSLLNWMTSLIRLRQACPEIGWGEWQILKTDVAQVLAMHYNWKGRSLIILHNFDERKHEVTLNLKQEPEGKLIDLLAINESVADEKGRHRITLHAYDYRWFRAEGMDDLIR